MAQSAGILLFRKKEDIEYLLVHPGGPYFKNKDKGWWTIPKGEPLTGEELFDAALREFVEETGFYPQPPYIKLNHIVQKGGKKVYCWASEGDIDTATVVCNTFTIEWPPKSGKVAEFPEIDRAEWFTFDKAKNMINEKQFAFIKQLHDILESKIV